MANEVRNAYVVMKELMNALQPLRQHFPVTEDPASRGVHHVSGSGWRRLSAIMDSGSAECVAPESIAKTIPLVETEASRQGQTYHIADGGVIKNNGQKTVTMYSEIGDQYRARYQICKYHTSNDVFSRCKSVHKLATGKSDDELIQSDNKMRIGTRGGKFIIVD